MSRTVAIIQARMQSTRLPGKVLLDLAGRPMLRLMVERLRRARRLDAICLASDEQPANDVLAAFGKNAGLLVHRGEVDDVLARYAGAAVTANADVIVRVTADCPFIDPVIIDELIELRDRERLDYCTNVLPPTWPDGLDVSVFTRALLETASREAALASEREHVVPWMWENCTLKGSQRYRAANLSAPRDFSNHRWTVDERNDYEFTQALAARLGDKVITAGWRDIMNAVEQPPALAGINRHITRDEGYRRSLAQDMGAKR